MKQIIGGKKKNLIILQNPVKMQVYMDGRCTTQTVPVNPLNPSILTLVFKDNLILILLL